MFKHILAALTIGLVVACSTAPKVDMAKVTATATLVVADLKMAANAYIAATPQPDPAMVAKVQDAERIADALVASLPTVNPDSFGDAVHSVVVYLHAIMTALPPNAIPPATQAQVMAFAMVADVVAQQVAVK